MLHLLVFCVGALTGGTFAWICNARIAERDEEAAAKRARLVQIHLQGLHEVRAQLPGRRHHRRAEKAAPHRHG